MKNEKQGYTLVEVLIVMSIIGVIASFLLTGVHKAQQKSKLERVQILMDSIGAAIRMYQDDFGVYPPSASIISGSTYACAESECLYYFLGATFKRNANASVLAGPYIKFRGDELQFSQSLACDFDGDSTLDDINTIIDPWGNPFQYSSPPVNNLNTYDLYSQGPDGIDDSGGGDDVNNWD